MNTIIIATGTTEKINAFPLSRIEGAIKKIDGTRRRKRAEKESLFLQFFFLHVIRHTALENITYIKRE
jgi:hypothetical protein